MAEAMKVEIDITADDCDAMIAARLYDEGQTVSRLICNDRAADRLTELDGEGAYSIRQVILFTTPT